MDNINELLECSQSNINSDSDNRENNNKNIEKENNNSKLINEEDAINNLQNNFQNNFKRIEQNLITAINALQTFNSKENTKFIGVRPLRNFSPPLKNPNFFLKNPRYLS